MANHDMAGKIQTVTGPISPERLGVTMTHEHLLVSDPEAIANPPTEASRKRLFYEPISTEVLANIRNYGILTVDNANLTDVSTAIEEAMLYKQYGGDTIVDPTCIGLGRDPTGLARIARATGLNIIMGGSYFVDVAHPPDMDSRSEDELSQQLARDVTEGVDGTGIKSGVIGEVGCSWPLADNERKVLRASGRAQRITGAPLYIDPGRNENAPLEILEVLSSVGADLAHTNMCHIERTVLKRGVLKQVAESGCYIGVDLFGREQSYYPSNVAFDMPNDATRMDLIEWLSSEGHGDRVVVSQDVATKHRLFKNGGHGYFYLLAHIVPRMRARGFSDGLIQEILVDNPKRMLTFREPKQT